MSTREIFLVAGAGTMGERIALQAALSGYHVRVYEPTQKPLDQAKQWMQAFLAKQDPLNSSKHSEIIAHVHFTTHLEEAAEHAFIVSESITEDLQVKRSFFEQLTPLLPEQTLVTTNTSYLLPSDIAAACVNPSMFCAFHFHDVFFANVVDIMPHPGTQPSLIPRLEWIARKLQQIPVVIKQETPGYIFNAMLLAILGTAGKMHAKGLANIIDIDRSWMGNFKMKIGPFGILDTIGLDTAWHVIKNRKDDGSILFAELLQTYIREGKLGVKTGSGFYTYPNPEYAHVDFLKP